MRTLATFCVFVAFMATAHAGNVVAGYGPGLGYGVGPGVGVLGVGGPGIGSSVALLQGGPGFSKTVAGPAFLIQTVHQVNQVHSGGAIVAHSGLGGAVPVNGGLGGLGGLGGGLGYGGLGYGGLHYKG